MRAKILREPLLLLDFCLSRRNLLHIPGLNEACDADEAFITAASSYVIPVITAVPLSLDMGSNRLTMTVSAAPAEVLDMNDDQSIRHCGLDPQYSISKGFLDPGSSSA